MLALGRRTRPPPRGRPCPVTSPPLSKRPASTLQTWARSSSPTCTPITSGLTGLFPNADILVQRAELAWSTLSLPQERLVLLDGDSTLAAGIEIVATPGHTPGHQSVIVDDQLAITGDVLVHALQLVAPEAGYAHEMDPDLARETRITLLSKGLTLATPHLTEPFVAPPVSDQTSPAL